VEYSTPCLASVQSFYATILVSTNASATSSQQLQTVTTCIVQQLAATAVLTLNYQRLHPTIYIFQAVQLQ